MGMLEQTSLCTHLSGLLGFLALQVVSNDEDPGGGTGDRLRTVKVAARDSTPGPPERADHTPCSMLGLKVTH